MEAVAARAAAARAAAEKETAVRAVKVRVGREADWDPDKTWRKPRIDWFPP